MINRRCYSVQYRRKGLNPYILCCGPQVQVRSCCWCINCIVVGCSYGFAARSIQTGSLQHARSAHGSHDTSASQSRGQHSAMGKWLPRGVLHLQERELGLFTSMRPYLRRGSGFYGCLGPRGEWGFRSTRACSLASRSTDSQRPTLRPQLVYMLCDV